MCIYLPVCLDCVMLPKILIFCKQNFMVDFYYLVIPFCNVSYYILLWKIFIQLKNRTGDFSRLTATVNLNRSRNRKSWEKSLKTANNRCLIMWWKYACHVKTQTKRVCQAKNIRGARQPTCIAFALKMSPSSHFLSRAFLWHSDEKIGLCLTTSFFKLNVFETGLVVKSQEYEFIMLKILRYFCVVWDKEKATWKQFGLGLQIMK